MPDHVRKQLRDAVVAALQSLPTTGSRVYSGRTWKLAEIETPALLVFARGGASQLDSMDDGLQRDERLVVMGLVQTAGEEPDDKLDAIAAEVEARVMADPGLGALVLLRELINSELTAEAVDAMRHGTLTLTWRMVLRTAAGTPTEALI